ncbi:hypothetical protein [Saccharibacillus sp. JS10]|uniref:hypothetical protein n=1 Tax=Saccharibacillus sp. JS10 TaxID=2950552 RepID=UPI00210EC7BD|nr:hypothetical protein [Saccharibacillus sp. JS10]MCQ4086348.1 hypothetical protein [Saccharibacillus sp. JS10]
MNKKKMMTLSAALLLTIALTACGQGQSNTPVPQETDTETVTPPTAETDTTPDDQTEEEDQVIQAMGTYNGQADPHTIEVEVDGMPTSFQISEDTASQLQDLKEGDAVTIEYVQQKVEGSDVPVLQIQTITPGGSSSSASGGEGSEEGATSERPATETFELMTEGTLDKRTATLEQGDGYSLYVFDAYSFDAAENKLFLTAYPEYEADIEKLPADFDLDEWRAKLTNELKEYGEVREYAGDQLAEGPMSRATLVLQVSDEKGMHEYAIWEPEGENGYVFRLHAPEGEASENFATPALTSLTTIKADPAASK